MNTSLALDFARALDPTLIARDVGLDRLDDWQAKLIDEPPKRLLCCCGRQVGKSTAAAALMNQTAYASQVNQKFGFKAMSNVSGMYSFPTYSIINRNSGKSLALPKLSAAADLQTQQSTFTSASYQQWMIRPVGGGVYSICNWGSSLSSTMCLAVKDLLKDGK